jgi:hypothetical protein
VAVVALLWTSTPAWAEPQISLDPAPDGTLVLVGSGWRPGQHMVVSVGQRDFPALADSVGEFEVPTGLVSSGGPPAVLAIHRPEAQVAMAPASQAQTQAQAQALTQAAVPHPLAVLFAQSLMTGSAFLALSAAGVSLVALAARYVHCKRRAGD